MKRDRWTEQDLQDLPLEEPDRFDRKSGLYDKQDGFLTAVAKALSAFANFGGGRLILGVADNGKPDGLPSRIGNASMRDWIEQKIPTLLDYRLSDFRVHTVIRSEHSAIPQDRDVIVIEVGDGALAPHQSTRDHHYYQRVGGRSLPAGHFYLELLRQRLTNPTLNFQLANIRPKSATLLDGLFFLTELDFRVANTGRVAAYKWSLQARSISGDDLRPDRFFFSGFPTGIRVNSPISIDPTVLPRIEVTTLFSRGRSKVCAFSTIDPLCVLRCATQRLRWKLLHEKYTLNICVKARIGGASVEGLTHDED